MLHKKKNSLQLVLHWHYWHNNWHEGIGMNELALQLILQLQLALQLQLILQLQLQLQLVLQLQLQLRVL
jgi:hypothetical protein